MAYSYGSSGARKGPDPCLIKQMLLSIPGFELVPLTFDDDVEDALFVDISRWIDGFVRNFGGRPLLEIAVAWD